MGMLYLAWDPQLERNVAIKVLLQNDERLRKRFLREARSAARLQHRHIITVYDVGSHQGQPFIAMEYIPGFTLETVIDERREVAVEQKLRWIEELCDGLGYAHAAGIVHRDIKPANLMIDRSGSVQILDFGIARVLQAGNLTQAGMVLGTLNYMSPEQLSGRDIDHRSDIHAVGAVLYELLTYRQAFPGTLADGLVGLILQREPKPLESVIPAIDARVADTVRRALQKDPADRYQDLDAMKRDLERIRQGAAPTVAHPLARAPAAETPTLASTPSVANSSSEEAPPSGSAPTVMIERPSQEGELQEDDGAVTAPSPGGPPPEGGRKGPSWRVLGLVAAVLVLVSAGYLVLRGDGTAGPAALDGESELSDITATPPPPVPVEDSTRREDTVGVPGGEDPTVAEPATSPGPSNPRVAPRRLPPECEQLLVKQSLGEPLTEAEEEFLTERCRT